MKRGDNRCEYVLRQAGHSYDGRPLDVGYGGDTTQVCGKFGRTVQHTYHVKRPGTTNVYEPREGTAVRCSEHEQLP